jgi:hypothetical protein
MHGESPANKKSDIEIQKRPSSLRADSHFSSGNPASGGAEEDRTPDLVIANDALSHLSYGPVPLAGKSMTEIKPSQEAAS